MHLPAAPVLSISFFYAYVIRVFLYYVNAELTILKTVFQETAIFASVLEEVFLNWSDI